VEEGRINGEDDGGKTWWMYFVHGYENRTIKPVEIVLRRGAEMKKNDGGLNLIKIHHKHIYKCHNEIPHTTNASQ
jgi:hypothetical protein